MNEGEFASLAATLRASAGLAAERAVVSGFDAFVDEVGHVVATRQSPDAYEPVPTIAAYAEWVAASAGRSGLREFVIHERAAGGCTVNMGDGIATLGFPLDVFAGLGDPTDPAFDGFASKCRSVDTLGMTPGRTVVAEFEDGKLMLCTFSHFAAITPDYFRTALAGGGYRAACEQASAIVLTSWSVFPHMTQCWEFLQKEIFSGLLHRPRFFFDLADPASRSPDDLVQMAEALAGFEACGPTTLSLNGAEANQLARALGIPPANLDSEEIIRLCTDLRERIGISELGVHIIKAAASATADSADLVPGPYCAKPAKSVGAGDRFNAGWLAGYMLGLDLRERLLLGVVTSGFFVRMARSGTLDEVASFAQLCEEGRPDAIIESQ